MDLYTVLYNTRAALLCISFLVGAGFGIYAITRQQQTTGWLTLIGFLLLGIDPVAEVLIFRVFMRFYTGENFDIFNGAYVCISAPAYLIGVGCIIAALFKTMKTQSPDMGDAPADVPEP